MNVVSWSSYASMLDAIGWILLHSLWQGTLIAIGLALALRLVDRKRATLRYGMACVALLLIPVMPILTAVESGEGTIATAPVVVESALEPAIGSGTETVSVQPVPVLASNHVGWKAFLIGYLNRYMSWIVLCWGFGVILQSLRYSVAWGHSIRIRKRGIRSVGTNWMDRLDVLQQRLHMSKSVNLFASTLVEVPTVVGWLKPVILIPVSVFSGLRPDQIEMIIAHELAHIKRHDYLVNFLQTLCETIFFFHPAVWWISRQIRVTREHCCDDLAVEVSGNPVSYVESLISLAGSRQTAPQWAFAANGGSLSDRVKRLLGMEDEAAGRSARWSAGMILCLTLIGAAYFSPVRTRLLGLDRSGETAEPIIVNRIETTFHTVDNPAQTEALGALEQIVFGHLMQSVQMGALDGIGDVENDLGLPVLIRTAQTHPDRTIRNEAVQKMAYTASPEAVDVLEGLVFADESKSIQLEALDSLRKMNENRGLPSLMRIAEFHPDAELRNEAIQWMGRSGSATVVSLLKQIALEDLDKDNRKEAIDALGTLVDESAF